MIWCETLFALASSLPYQRSPSQGRTYDANTVEKSEKIRGLLDSGGVSPYSIHVERTN